MRVVPVVNPRNSPRSVRHNLSLNECFVKIERAANGKGNFWSVHYACLDDFRQGDYRRRQARRRATASTSSPFIAAADQHDMPGPLRLTGSLYVPMTSAPLDSVRGLPSFGLGPVPRVLTETPATHATPAITDFAAQSACTFVSGPKYDYEYAPESQYADNACAGMFRYAHAETWNAFNPDAQTAFYSDEMPSDL